ncbi:MAG: flavin reductase [Eubacteriales bacterium]|nr:flavin reductase [Eubacteriales bacterium]
MNCVRRITDELLYLGGSDRRLSKFENLFPLPRGIAYNSYLLLDDRTVLMDTVDHAVAEVFFENLEAGLNGRKLDYVVIHHMEPDHAATLRMLLTKHPEATVVCTAIAEKMIGQFFGAIDDLKVKTVGDQETLDVGHRRLTFYTAPMVHWPEVMVTYDPKDHTLFSADAFGTFGALGGNLYADELNFETEWLPDARRYYANIVGKYGPQVQTLLSKVSGLVIERICSLHGPVWRKNIGWYVDLYKKWSACEPEEAGVLVIYGSIYGHTQNAAEALASRLADRNVRVALYDASVTDVGELLSESWRFSHIVIASSTYNAGIFSPIEQYLLDIKAHLLHNRAFAVIENGSWAPAAGNHIRRLIGEMSDIRLLDPVIHIRSALRDVQAAQLDTLADALTADIAPAASAAQHTPNPAQPSTPVDPMALFKISYGLFVLTAREGDKDNGFIINTVNQITNAPNRLAVAVNKLNYTHDMIVKTGIFNISVLSRDTEFAVFKRFGYQSGRAVDKYEGFTAFARSENGLTYLTEHCNALISCKVIDSHDYQTHTLFVCELTEARILSDEPSVTYDDYFKYIKPKPQPTEKKVKGWRCKICGYIYEGDTLPPDYICPVCKHPASDFEPIGMDS